MIQIPEVTLKAIVDSVLDKVRDDYNDAVDKSTTFMYKALDGIVSGNYNFLEQAVKIINRTADDPRTIDTRLLFDKERASLPTIHVTIPNESPFSDGIGIDEGYQLATANDLGLDINGDPMSPVSMTEYYTRSYNSKFDLVITGSNTFEVIMIFYILKMALINNIQSLEANGFRNPKIYGGDLRINDQLAPVAYMRVLTIDSFCELTIPKFDNISIINNITFYGYGYE
jgi:hypothetical protein